MDERNEGYNDAESLMENQWPSNRPADVANVDDEGDIGDEEDSDYVAGTLDADEAVNEAEPYVPATDPPVLPGGSEGIHVATGFGLSPEEEAAQDPPPRGDDDIRQEAVLTLAENSLTSQYNLRVTVLDGVIHLRGVVDSIEVADHASWILGELQGVVDVHDDTELSEA